MLDNPWQSDKLVGVSLSACIPQLVENKVSLDDIAGLVSAIWLTEFGYVVASLEGDAWKGPRYFTQGCTRLAWQLWEEKRILFPRRTHGVIPMATGSFWKNWEEIEWMQI